MRNGFVVSAGADIGGMRCFDGYLSQVDGQACESIVKY